MVIIPVATLRFIKSIRNSFAWSVPSFSRKVLSRIDRIVSKFILTIKVYTRIIRKYHFLIYNLRKDTSRSWADKDDLLLNQVEILLEQVWHIGIRSGLQPQKLLRVLTLAHEEMPQVV